MSSRTTWLTCAVDDEVMWDERALAAFREVEPDALEPIGLLRADALAPSLHLNLGDGYLRQGRSEAAAAQLQAGLAAAHVLADDGYGVLIHTGLEGLQARLAETGS